MRRYIGIVTILLNLLVIGTFTAIYIIFADRFENTFHSGEKVGWLDCLQLSATLQSSAAYTPLQPKDAVGKGLVTTQTLLMIIITSTAISEFLKLI